MAILLVEDNRTPGARERFIKDMKDQFGLDFRDFKKNNNPFKTMSLNLKQGETNPLYTEWWYKDYVLTLDQDQLYKLETYEDPY